MKQVFFILVVLFSSVITSCSGAGPHAVRDATLRDTVFSVETKENGSHFVWMVHDDVGVYCTMNDVLFKKVTDIFYDKTHPADVFIKYISSNLGSDENKNFFQDPLGISGCKHEKATVYVITEVLPVYNTDK